MHPGLRNGRKRESHSYPHQLYIYFTQQNATNITNIYEMNGIGIDTSLNIADSKHYRFLLTSESMSPDSRECEDRVVLVTGGWVVHEQWFNLEL